MTDKTMTLDYYDAGLLGDGGGGDVSWWQDYIRSELARAHEFYQDQADAITRHLSQPAERIEADESAVPAAWQYRYKNDRMQWSRWIEWAPEEHPEAPFPKMIGRWEVEYRKLFAHPPAQAAQVDPAAKPHTLADFVHAPDAERAQIGQQVAARVDEMMAEPVAQPPAVGVPDYLIKWLEEKARHAPASGVICAPTSAMGDGWKAKSLLSHLATPSPTIDVAAVREVIEGMRCVSRLAGENDLRLRDTCAGASDKLARAIGDAK